MDAHDFSMTLSGGGQPIGEIALGDLAALAGAMQQLATRVGRLLTEQEGPGRTSEAAERATRLRLTGLRAGSTMLMVGYGERDVMDVGAGLEAETAERFWEVVEGIATGRRPEWVTPLVAQAADALIDATAQASPRVLLRRADKHKRVMWAGATVDRGAWVMAEASETVDDVLVSGRLEAVDLKSGRFRLRDDVGNGIDVEQVEDPPEAARLVGSRVSATGPAVRDAKGRLRLGAGTRLFATPLPAEWSVDHRVDWSASLGGAAPDYAGVPGLTGEDVKLFLAELHR